MALPNTVLAGSGHQTLIGWNNLGMHCMDDDYSVFTILPPNNTVDAHFLDATGNLVTSDDGVTVTYEAMADPDGSINSTVVGKSNFWDFVLAGYGADVPLEWGLAGTRMPGPANGPQPMIWDGSFQWFEGLGPSTPYQSKPACLASSGRGWCSRSGEQREQIRWASVKRV